MGVASGLAGPPLPSETSAEPEVVFQVPTTSPATQDETGATRFAYVIRIYMIYAFQHGTKPAAQENWFDILRLSLHIYIYIIYIYVHVNLFLFGRRGRPQALAVLRQLSVARTLWPSLPRKSKTRRTKYHQSRPRWLLRVPGPGLMAPRPMTIVGIGGTFKHRQDGLPPRTSKGIQVHPAEPEPRGLLFHILYGVAGTPRCLEGNWALRLRGIIVQLTRTPE